MTISQRIGQASYREREFELRRQCMEFGQIAHMLMSAGGDTLKLKQLARENRGRVGEIVKAAVDAGGLSASSVWGSQFADYKLTIAGFAQALSNYGLFDRMLPSMRRVPLLSATVGVITTPGTAYVISEGSMKAVSKFSLANGQLDPKKASCIVVQSQELLRNTAESQRLLTSDMINAAALAIDISFLAVATSGVSVATSSGSTALSVRNDLQNLLRLVSTDARSRLFLATTSAIAKNISMMGATSTNASPAFEGMTYQGGVISGVEVVVSDAVTQGQMVLMDAEGFAGAIEPATVQVLTEGTVTASDTPDSPTTAATLYQSFWQLNLAGLLCERWYGAQRVRTNSVAIVSNSADYGGANSPP